MFEYNNPEIKFNYDLSNCNPEINDTMKEQIRQVLEADEVKEDNVEITDQIRKNADAGIMQDMLLVANDYYQVNVDDEKAVEWYKRILQKDSECAEALLSMAYYYRNGVIVEKSESKALEYYTKAAELGDGYAYCKIGELYGDGCIVEQDYSKALEYYLKAAELGSNKACYEIGDIYYYGNGVGQDYNKAFEYYTRAAKNEYPAAISSLAIMYADGKGVEKDLKIAYEYCIKAAVLGDDIVVALLAKIFKYGGYVPVDEKISAYLTEKASLMGKISTMFETAEQYRIGTIVEKDLVKAAYWHEESATYGNADAMYILAQMYALGMGVSFNCNKADYWFDCALKNGIEKVPECRKKIYKDYTVAALRQMSIEQLMFALDCGNIHAATVIALKYGEQGNTEKEIEYYNKSLNICEEDKAFVYTQLAIKYESIDVKKSFEYALEGSKRGNYNADYLLGQYYKYGTGTEVNLVKSYEYYLKAEEGGVVHAIYPLALCYCTGSGTTQDMEKGVYYLFKTINTEKVPDNQVRAAHDLLGQFYQNGIYGKDGKTIIEKDAEKAIHSYEITGTAENYEKIADIYGDELKDCDKEYMYLKKSCEMGNLKAKFRLSAMNLFDEFSTYSWFNKKYGISIGLEACEMATGNSSIANLKINLLTQIRCELQNAIERDQSENTRLYVRNQAERILSSLPQYNLESMNNEGFNELKENIYRLVSLLLSMNISSVPDYKAFEVIEERLSYMEKYIAGSEILKEAYKATFANWYLEIGKLRLDNNLEEAKRLMEKAQYFGSEEAKSYLRRFKRSLFGKLTFN